MRTPVRHMRVHRLGMRSRHHVQASVVERRLGHRQPDADLRPRAEREVVRILMPRLSERAVIFENELADETVEFGSDQIAHEVEHRGILDQRFEDRIAMQPENFADVVLGISREWVGFLFRQHEDIRNTLPRRIHAANLDHPRMHRPAGFDRRETANDEEPLLVPVALAFNRQHRATRRNSRWRCGRRIQDSPSGEVARDT